jgi:hypothetical protein
MNSQASSPEPVTFIHSSPVLGWIALPAIISAFGYAVYTGKIEHGLLLGASLALIAIAISLLGAPRVVIVIARDAVVIREAWLWGKREKRYDAADLIVPEIVEVRGQDGTNYACYLQTPDGREFVVSSGGWREDVYLVRHRLIDALAVRHADESSPIGVHIQ